MLSLFSVFTKTSEEDQELAKSVNSMTSARAVGRGGLQIDPKEISQSVDFKDARARAKKLIAS